MARSQAESLAEEICNMAFRNKEFLMKLEVTASDMIVTYFQMKRNARDLWDCFEDFSENLQHLDVYLREEHLEALIEEFRDNLEMKTPDFTQLYQGMVEQHRRLSEVTEDLLSESYPHPQRGYPQALIDYCNLAQTFSIHDSYNLVSEMQGAAQMLSHEIGAMVFRNNDLFRQVVERQNVCTQSFIRLNQLTHAFDARIDSWYSQLENVSAEFESFERQLHAQSLINQRLSAEIYSQAPTSDIQLRARAAAANVRIHHTGLPLPALSVFILLRFTTTYLMGLQFRPFSFINYGSDMYLSLHLTFSGQDLLDMPFSNKKVLDEISKECNNISDSFQELGCWCDNLQDQADTFDEDLSEKMLELNDIMVSMLQKSTNLERLGELFGQGKALTWNLDCSDLIK